MGNPFRIGERVYLRPIELEDVPRLARWVNDPEVHEGLSVLYPKNLERERAWVEGLYQRPEEVVFLIVAREGEVPIGSCGLHQIQLANRKAVFGILIGEKAYWNQGYGSEALHLIAEYGFNSLNLHRIELSVYEYNARAIRCYQKAGFREEGRKREGRFWNGRYWDVLEMGILAREFRQQEGERRAESRRAVAAGAAAEASSRVPVCQTGPGP
ncbi:MAG: GNAT family N-acetyltransferase [Planctomycetes bacterium]|nr:GNAT family N-acetyltransferase [Planctomycetota bacterium]